MLLRTRGIVVQPVNKLDAFQKMTVTCFRLVSHDCSHAKQLMTGSFKEAVSKLVQTSKPTCFKGEVFKRATSAMVIRACRERIVAEPRIAFMAEASFKELVIFQAIESLFVRYYACKESI